METLQVACGCLQKNGKVFIAKRKNGGWEFPGGKIEPGESKEECVIREIEEELGIKTTVKGPAANSSVPLDGKIIKLSCFFLSWDRNQQIKLQDHAEYAWVRPQHLTEYNLLPTDIPLAKEIFRYLADNEVSC